MISFKNNRKYFDRLHTNLSSFEIIIIDTLIKY